MTLTQEQTQRRHDSLDYRFATICAKAENRNFHKLAREAKEYYQNGYYLNAHKLLCQVRPMYNTNTIFNLSINIATLLLAELADDDRVSGQHTQHFVAILLTERKPLIAMRNAEWKRISAIEQPKQTDWGKYRKLKEAIWSIDTVIERWKTNREDTQIL